MTIAQTKWFKHYCDGHSNPKLRCLPKDVQLFWWHLLELKALDVYPAPVAEIAYRVHETEADVERFIATLTGAGLLNGEDAEVVNWDERQPALSDRERQARHRARKKAERNGEVTGRHVTGRDARHDEVTARNAEKRIREEKKRKEEERARETTADASPAPTPSPSVPKSDGVMIPTSDAGPYEITAAQIASWAAEFDRVNVPRFLGDFLAEMTGKPRESRFTLANARERLGKAQDAAPKPRGYASPRPGVGVDLDLPPDEEVRVVY